MLHSFFSRVASLFRALLLLGWWLAFGIVLASLPYGSLAVRFYMVLGVRGCFIRPPGTHTPFCRDYFSPIRLNLLFLFQATLFIRFENTWLMEIP